MAGTIKIRPAVFNKTASSFGVRWSPGTNQTGNAFDVRYRVDGGAWKTWKNHVAAAQAVFGAGNSPSTSARGTPTRSRPAPRRARTSKSERLVALGQRPDLARRPHP